MYISLKKILYPYKPKIDSELVQLKLNIESSVT